MILEQENIAQARVSFEIQDAIPKSPEKIFDPLFRKVGERYFMLRALDDYFVRSHATHTVIQAFALAVEHAFDTKRRELVWDYAQIPAPVPVLAVGEDFGRCIRFVATAKGTTPVGLG
jgi:hypothetical protein